MALEPIRPGSLSHGPPELVQTALKAPDLVTIRPPIVSPTAVEVVDAFFLASVLSFFSVTYSKEFWLFSDCSDRKENAFCPQISRGGLVIVSYWQ